MDEGGLDDHRDPATLLKKRSPGKPGLLPNCDLRSFLLAARLAEPQRVAVGQVLIEATRERDVEVLRRRVRVPRRLVV